MKIEIPKRRATGRSFGSPRHGTAWRHVALSPTRALGAPVLGCTAVGPKYARPKQAIPNAFKEAGPWKEAVPQDLLARGDWWEIFNDPALNDLELQAQKTNLGLQAAAARVQQAQAVAGISGSFLYPELNFNPSATRYAVSKTRPDQPSKQPGNVAYDINDFRLPLYASYAVDVWGKIRRLTEAAEGQGKANLAPNYPELSPLEATSTQTHCRI